MCPKLGLCCPCSSRRAGVVSVPHWWRDEVYASLYGVGQSSPPVLALPDVLIYGVELEPRSVLLTLLKLIKKRSVNKKE